MLYPVYVHPGDATHSHDIDEAARASGATRSGFLAKAARQAMTA